MDSFLRQIFAALDRAEIAYCLLRGFEELDAPAGSREVDLLVAPEHLSVLAKTLAARGFVALPAWGHAPHHFFVAYDRMNGAWLKFDVVTDLRYGQPYRTLRVGLAANCLRQRQRREFTFVLSPADEFFTLFLHCLLDKGSFREARRERLLELRRQMIDDKTIATQAAAHVARYLAPAMTWERLTQAIDADDWQALVKRRAQVARRLFWRNPLLGAWRYLVAAVLRRIKIISFVMGHRGLSVALLAPDGAGKSTLAKELTRDLYLRGRLIYMGTNIEASTVGLPTTRWLHRSLKARNGKFKKMSPSRIVFKGLGFVNRLAEQWYRAGAAIYHLMSGRLVVFDRYFYDSWINKRFNTPWKRLRRKLFESICPTPDLVILLDAPGQLLYDRKHEHTPEWLESQRRAYLALKDHLPQMRVIDAANQAEEVKREVTSLIWNQRRLRIGKNSNSANLL
jgi:thymidylate kinase